MVVLYTNHCPLCNTLKDMLDNNNIEYVEETNVQVMLQKGLANSPMPRLQLNEDEPILTYKQALQWLKEKR